MLRTIGIDLKRATSCASNLHLTFYSKSSLWSIKSVRGRLINDGYDEKTSMSDNWLSYVLNKIFNEK